MHIIALWIVIAAIGTPVLCIAIMLFRRYIDLRRRGWTVMGSGRDAIAYKERNNGVLIFDAELLVGPVSRIIQIPTATWNTRFPHWARDRRDEIVDRLKQKLPEPKYQYTEEN